MWLHEVESIWKETLGELMRKDYWLQVIGRDPLQFSPAPAQSKIHGSLLFTGSPGHISG